jgi:hypothetical protein
MTIYNGNTSVLSVTGALTTPLSGLVTFTLTKTQTAAFYAPTLMTYEIEVLFGDGTKFTATRDYMEIIKDLT